MATGDPGPVGPLRVIAWIALAGGVLGAALFWSEANQPVATEDLFGDFSLEEETNPIAIAMGFFALLQGVLVWAALMVFASMGENVAVIAAHADGASGDPVPPTEQPPLPDEPAPMSDVRDGWGG